VTLREEAATDQKLTKLARSIINVKAKKAPTSNEKESGGVTGAIKRVIEKVKG
jgi:hypothetical protein